MAASPGITQNSIAGLKLGLSPATYKKLVGAPAIKLTLTDPDNKPTGFWRLAFPNLSVYFQPKKSRGGVVITTWDTSYKTALGIGPCSTLSELKLAYGNRLKPSKFNTQHGVVYAYTVGKNLIFATPNHSWVDVVGLYNGSDANAGKSGGSLPWAGYIVLSERTCHRQ